jgi:hypothetical protein
MKTFLECMDLAAREVGDTGFKNWLNFKLDAEQLEHLQRAAEIYASQSNSHKPVVGGPGSDVRSEGEQLPAEGQGEANTCAVFWCQNEMYGKPKCDEVCTWCIGYKRA